MQISSFHSKTGRKQEVVTDQRGRKWEDYCTQSVLALESQTIYAFKTT